MTDQSADHYDVLIVGAGAAGACVAWSLGRRGLRVVCLEQGDWVSTDDMPKAHDDWQTRNRHDWQMSAAKRQGPDDYPVANFGETPVDPYFYAKVGGSVTGWGGAFWRFNPSDFATRTMDDFGTDWPFGLEELTPYYDLNEQMMGLSGFPGDPTAPPKTPAPMPPVDMGLMGDKWMEAFERLGWAWWVQELAIATRPWKGRPACENRGFCTSGCPIGALASPANTYWPEALEAGVELITGARVREVTVSADGTRATGVIWYDRDGALRETRAAVVVVAANGIGTPRLLLMSTSAHHPEGLANGSGQVGRNLMVHPQTAVIGRFPYRTEADHGPWGATATTRQFYETDPERGFKRGFIITAMRGMNPIDTALQTAPWGEGHHAALEHHLNHEAVVWVCGDDAGEPHNRVELDEDNRDAWGLPGVKTRYSLSENSRRLGEAAIARATELCEAAGATSVRTPGMGQLLGWHLLGTARMGPDPATSVVDPDCKAHEVDGLYVVDGSVMPAGGTVNPTNTVQAVALRAADKIAVALGLEGAQA